MNHSANTITIKSIHLSYFNTNNLKFSHLIPLIYLRILITTFGIISHSFITSWVNDFFVYSENFSIESYSSNNIDPSNSTFDSTVNSQMIISQVRLDDPTIIFNDLTKIFGDPNFDLTATSSSTGSFSYTSDNQSIATISGNTITVKAAGSIQSFVESQE